MVERDRVDVVVGAGCGGVTAGAGVPSEDGWARLEARRARLRLVVDEGAAARRFERVAAAEAWLTGADEALAALSGDLGGVAGEVVSERLRRVSVVAERVQATVARLAGALDVSAQWSVEGASSARAWLMAESGIGAGAAGRAVGVGRLVERFAVTGAALADGVMTASQAEVLASVALAKGRGRVYERDEAVLVAAAEALDLHEFTQVVRRWAHLADDELDEGEPAAAFERRGVSFAVLPSGNLRITGELDATGGALVQAAFVAFDAPDPADDDVAPRTVSQRRADFLAALAARMLSERNAEASAPIATVDVVVDAEHLARLGARGAMTVPGDVVGAGLAADDAGGRDGPDPPGDPDDTGDALPGGLDTGDASSGGCGGTGPPGGGLGGRPGTAPAVGDPFPFGWADAVGTGPVPGPTLVQLLCDSWVGRIVMAGRSEPLDVGRRTRTWSAAQRRAIVARDRHCTHPGCTRGPEWCQIHHIVPWDLHGDTDVGNGTLLCLWHHTHHHLTHHHLTGRHRHRRRPLVARW